MTRILRLAAWLVALGASPLAAQDAETRPPERSEAVAALPVVEEEPVTRLPGDRPAPRANALPRARWEHRRNGELWTRVALSAVETHGSPLIEVVPRDIEDWCPAYAGNGPEKRAAFWAALLSTLSRYESTWNPRAVGGGGRWFGLLQIYPQTADFRRCRARTGEGLKRAAANLNCAVRIMAITVPRDMAISLKENRWKGVAADWGPIRNDWMRRDMQRYTRRQTYCRPLADVRPVARP